MSRIVTSISVALLIICAAQVAAQDCSMIVLYEDADGNLVDQISAYVGLVNAHLVLNCEADQVVSFEAGIQMDPPVLFVVSMSGPNGFMNWGTLDEIIAGYTTPLPVQEQTILCSLALLLVAEVPVTVCVTDPSFSDGNSEHDCLGLCSEINPVVAAAPTTFSVIKGMFDQHR